MSAVASPAPLAAARPPAGERPIAVLLCALGGEGGGVLAEWLVETAIASGHPVQSTSIPGVAQRTGATTYYVEVFPRSAHELGGKTPVFSLNPVPGAIDLLVSSELLETVRQIGNGMSSADRTVAISSTSRALTTAEKMRLGDGRASSEALLQVVRDHSAEAQVFDMAAVAQQSGTVISAVMFGAIAGSGLLPLSRAACEATIRRGGKSAEASLRGFGRAFERVQSLRRERAAVHDAVAALSREGTASNAATPAASFAPSSLAIPGAGGSAPGPGPAGDSGADAVGNSSRPGSAPARTLVAATGPSAAPTSAAARDAAPSSAEASVLAQLPAALRGLATLGHARLLDYQGPRYADLYVERLQRVIAAEQAGDPQCRHEWATSREAARYLALWMAFDDIVRVAELKCRRSRLQRVRSEVKAGDDDLVKVYDHFKPGVPEFAALLPARLAAALLEWDRRRMAGGKAPLALPMKIGTHTIAGAMALRALAGMKWLRPRGSRYAHEQAMIERWLAGIERGAREHWALGHEIAACGRLVKGYGATNERGKENLVYVLDHLATPASGDGEARAAAIRAARSAALADDTGSALDAALRERGAPPRPLKAQPVRWVRSRPGAAAGRPQ